MNSLAIELRPRSFDEVVGLKTTVRSIQKTLAEGRIPRGFIFSGPSGTGKTTLAKIIAREINGAASDEDMELTEVNCGADNGVDFIRELAQDSAYSSFCGTRKIYLLDEAQQLTPQAQNALLIPLESTNNDSIFFFCTTEPGKILATVKTRCLAYALNNPTHADMEVLVRRATDRLGIDYSPELAAAAAKAGLGARAALQAVEKYAGGVGVREAVSQPEHEPLYADIAKAVLAGNWNRSSEYMEKVKAADVGGLRSVLAAFFRNEIIRSGISAKSDSLAAALLAMGQFTAYETGVSYGITTAILYKLCKSLQAT